MRERKLRDGSTGWERPAWVLLWGGIPVGVWDDEDIAADEGKRLITDFKQHFPWKAPPPAKTVRVPLVTRQR